MTKLTQTSWLGGQMDVRMTGRQDMANYRNGASVLKNFVPVKLGSIRKRPGTDLVADLTDWVGTNKFRMIPFGYLGDEGYVLVLCPDATPKARAYKGDGTYVIVDGSIDYSADEIDEIGYVQCGDVLFLAHKKHPPAKISHDVDKAKKHVFSFSVIVFNPISDRPEIEEIIMTRQFFEDFTFSDLDQKELDFLKANYYNMDTWGKPGVTDPMYERYKDIYEKKRIYSGKKKEKYRASLVIDGIEGPLSEEASVEYTEPWTESQVVTVKFKEVDVRNSSIRLYKQNGGLYGLIGDCKSDDFSQIPIGTITTTVNLSKTYYPRQTGWWIWDGVVYKLYISTSDDLHSKDIILTNYWIAFKGYEENPGVWQRFYDSIVVNQLIPENAARAHIFAEVLISGLSESESEIVDLETFYRKSGITISDDNIAPDMSETPIDESDGLPFSEDGNYPGSVGLYQQRLVWAGSQEDPARIWMSRAGDLYEYRPHVKLQLDDAIDFILPITQFANINFIIELGRLFVFSEGAELVVGSSSTTQGISYETIMATEHSHLGCTKRLPPIVANNMLLFVNRTGQSVRTYDEELGATRFGGTDASVLSAGIFADNPIVDWTWQQEPNSTVWCVLKDGRLASFTYDKEQKIAAWAVHEMGCSGAVKAKALGIAKTCAVFGRDASHPTTGEIMVAVERGRKVTLERMRPWGAADGSEADRLCMDCMESGDKSSKGKTYFADFDVSGYPFESVMTTMPPVIGDQGGASQFDVKLGQHAHLRTVGSQGGEIYAVGMRNQPSEIDKGAVRDGEDGAEFRDVDVVLAGSNNRDGRVTVRHDEPWPFQLALLELDYEVEAGG